MKTLCDFLRRHALLLLAALVVLSVPAGVALGKYVGSVTVTSGLKLNVRVSTVKYYMKGTVWDKIYSTLKTNGTNLDSVQCTLKVVNANDVPENLSPIENGITHIVLDLCDDQYEGGSSGSIYAYFDDKNKTIYIAPKEYGTIYATSCHQMFGPVNLSGKSVLKGIVLNNFNTSLVQDMSDMFAYNIELKKISFGRSFYTVDVTNMNRMFSMCTSLETVNLSTFNTSSVTDMSYMFSNCKVLKSLDLSSFNTANVTNMEWMFNNCAQLKTITVSNGFNVDAVKDSINMFALDTNLIGGAGTKCDGSNHTDKTYARIDNLPTSPGYFTSKNANSTTNTATINNLSNGMNIS